MNKNLQMYSTEESAAAYSKKRFISPAEKTINSIVLMNVVKELEFTSMLDIGVGAGRTTEYFAPLFYEYVGIDYSVSMINACRKQYPATYGYRWITADILHLPYHLKADFVFFSAQGISCMETIDQVQECLKICYNLTKESGIFAFSFHTAAGLDYLYKFHLPKRNPLRLISEYFRWKSVHKVNGSKEQYQGKDYFQLNGLAWHFKPSWMLQAVKQAGFDKGIGVVAMDGSFIPIAEIDSCTDNRLHFVCYK